MSDGMQDQTAGWGEHRMLVLNSLERIHDDMQLMRKEITDFRSVELGSLRKEMAIEQAIQRKDIAELRYEIGMLKVKAATIGAICGAIPAVVSLIYTLAKK